jgi:hypothetical protein
MKTIIRTNRRRKKEKKKKKQPGQDNRKGGQANGPFEGYNILCSHVVGREQ